MEFQRLSDRELQKFLIEYPALPLSQSPFTKNSLVEQAHQLFSELQKSPNSQYPEIISDLYLASLLKPQLQNAPVYTFSQIQNCTPEQLQSFAKSFGLNSNITKGRIFQLLDFCNLIDHSPYQNMLLQPDILEGVCAHLSFQEANKMRINKKLQTLICRLPVVDPDGQITSLPRVDSDTAYLYPLIAKHGSKQLLMEILSEMGEIYNSLPKHLQTKDARSRLAKILILEMSDFNYVSQYNRSPLMEALLRSEIEIVRMLLEKGADPNFKQHGRSLMEMAATYNNADIEKVKLLLAYGAKPNPMMARGTYYASATLPVIDYMEIMKLDPEIIQVLKEAALI